MRASINLAVIAGDGIGPEIVPEGLKVLRAALAESSTELSVTPYSIGAQRYLDTGETLSTADLEALAGHDALLLGAIGDPRVPAGILERVELPPLARGRVACLILPHVDVGITLACAGKRA
ncbi:isocitrate/isopropylmalate family dehydrogenase [Actinotignum sp. GS-2025b]|uniref:isocitrate/isopropylmalate family dehydrogenase n=1 Tax=Actinotignum sp. GS-2025b TaxID=3427275 RepID=UPI003F48109C